jgi:hypothetical protein
MVLFGIWGYFCAPKSKYNNRPGVPHILFLKTWYLLSNKYGEEKKRSSPIIHIFNF